jgi:hypothetical protein
MPSFMDLMIGRKGDSLTGKVLDKAFSIKSSFGSNEGVTLKIHRNKIHTIAIDQKMKIRGKLL